MSRAIVFLQQLVNTLSCSRRNSSAPHLTKVSGVGAQIGNTVRTSRGNRSNVSIDSGSNAVVVGASGFDTEASLRLRAHKSSHAKSPPGLSAPPGLELPVGDRYEPPKHGVNKCIEVETTAFENDPTLSSSSVSTDVGSDADAVSASGSDTEAALRLCPQKFSYVKPPPGFFAPPGLELPVGDTNKPPKHGVNAAVVSTSGLDTVSSLRLCAQKSSSAKPPPGLSAPPGLLLPVGDRHVPPNSSVNKAFNTEAKPFVPKNSWDQKLEECLRDITASSENDLASSSLAEFLKRRLQSKENGFSKNDVPRLDKVRRKLAADDTAIEKVALKVKEVSCVTDPPDTTHSLLRATVTEDETLRSILAKLADIDAGHVFMVRKINKLGSNSLDMLKTYFSEFGRIQNAYVTHNPHKRSHDEGPQAKPIRAPGVGFIVMEKVDDVAKIFQHGLQHTISDVRVSLDVYEHHVPKEVERNSSSDHTSKPRDVTERPYINLTKDNTLRSNLSKMAEIDASRIIMVRKINKLGLGSAQILEDHFGQIGIVTNVFVAHGIDRSSIDPEKNPHGRPHIRPAGIGFVVMEKADDVAAAFQNGFQQTVRGVNISLVEYKRQAPTEVGADSNGLEP